MKVGLEDARDVRLLLSAIYSERSFQSEFSGYTIFTFEHVLFMLPSYNLSDAAAHELYFHEIMTKLDRNILAVLKLTVINKTKVVS